MKPPGVETTGDEHVGLSMTDDAAWTYWMRKCQMIGLFFWASLENPQYIDDHATCALIDCITTSHLLHTHVRKSS